ncbi:MAG: DUF2721 domain-containing protein [Planctomycetales bacterium]|nr:DUF2721 domain-containing protein [Planctomycetales bacterium]MBN8626812.1 DUF2721 domain-containing protein [Planctomycetota bacterium]
MDPIVTNPLSILTFIVAPAILTNASSIMTLGTSNRFARAIDRARGLSAELKASGGAETPGTALRRRQLLFAERRALMLVRALTAFYVSVGSFGAASLVSLLAAAFFIIHHDLGRQIALGIGMFAGVCGVMGLVTGSLLLVYETRMALRILTEETEEMCKPV